MLSHANTIEEMSHYENLVQEQEDASQRLFKLSQSQLNIKNIHKLLLLTKRERTKAQLATLVKYFKSIKIFKDLLQREGLNVIKGVQEEEDLSFEQLASSVKVRHAEPDTMLMQEGEVGDLYYIILQGECQVLKATPIVIHTLTQNQDIEDRTPFYFKTIMENYADIYWAGMDITR